MYGKTDGRCAAIEENAVSIPDEHFEATLNQAAISVQRPALEYHRHAAADRPWPTKPPGESRATHRGRHKVVL